MDRRSWPWKKKSSEKVATTTDSTSASLSRSTSNQVDQDNTKTVNYVQLSVESYAHLTELEDQVKVLQEQLTTAQENLAAAHTEITTKDTLVKQHTKVAEEAVSGWEKAEAEALALKHQLESLTLLKLTAEERACHLDGALKECMKQIRNVKEDSEQKLHDVVFTKTKQWEKEKLGLDTRIAELEQELLQAYGENDALSTSLQDCSDMLTKINEEKTRAHDEIEMLKSNVQSCEREINSLKYEVHVVSKELEIRNEEKNMSMRSVEVANKQHLEDVKKITKLEAECQRLRGLVRKKLPGPAALAQMKLEVENLGSEYGESRPRRSPAKASSPHFLPVSGFALENIQQIHKENEFLTSRLLAVEEETKMLKEALAKRNSDLQASRNTCAKTVNKLHTLEAQVLSSSQQKIPAKINGEIHFENESNPPSLTSMSEDGIDEEGSCPGSWATSLMSELPQFKKDKDVNNGNKADNLKLMDDFLEMERLACLSTEANGSINNVEDKMRIGNDDASLLIDVPVEEGGKSPQSDLEPSTNQSSSNEEKLSQEFISDRNDLPLFKLQSRIVSMFESQAEDTDLSKILEGIRCILKNTQEELPQHSGGCIIEETRSIASSETMGEISNVASSSRQTSDHELKKAISQIYDIVTSLCEETMEVQHTSSENHGLVKKMEEFSASVSKVLSDELGLNDFILALSVSLSEATDLSLNILRDKRKEQDNNSLECIDKVTLLENRVEQHELTDDKFSGTSMLTSHSSDPEIEGAIHIGFEGNNTLQKCSMEEFEQLKMEKENMQMDVTRYTEMLEQTRLQLVETEKNLTELKSQLAASEKSNSFAETQLKCMTESYKSLESRAQELEAEINLLHQKMESLDDELQEERRSHQDDLVKYQELQEHIERNEKSSMLAFPSDVDVDMKTKQEADIEAAAERLAECQETILLLGRQLKGLHPAAEPLSSSPNNKSGDETNRSGLDHGSTNTHNQDQAEMESTSNSSGQSTGLESSDNETGLFPGSPISSKRQKHLSPGSSNALSEKHGRGFSRFFSKGKSDQ